MRRMWSDKFQAAADANAPATSSLWPPDQPAHVWALRGVRAGHSGTPAGQRGRMRRTYARGTGVSARGDSAADSDDARILRQDPDGASPVVLDSDRRRLLLAVEIFTCLNPATLVAARARLWTVVCEAHKGARRVSLGHLCWCPAPTRPSRAPRLSPAAPVSDISVRETYDDH
ncbi:hypothetical protein WOLCODRAFT_156409 [Wolfiporia cocos MD-104 SS10]|uniref:Uncharacterized protein n=1 Tax=Wolfiporia cocos (strain MD-104) TaxID=742152 RepID=A0A2H3JAD5_WOLCO|nr:hypothetical protein WOLCODRAFT_156409 [Wolfiporia cocos MD-104 SS10]